MSAYAGSKLGIGPLLGPAVAALHRGGVGRGGRVLEAHHFALVAVREETCVLGLRGVEHEGLAPLDPFDVVDDDGLRPGVVRWPEIRALLSVHRVLLLCSD